jgi:hypothetical protein
VSPLLSRLRGDTRTGVYLCHWRIRAGMGVDGVLHLCLKSCTCGVCNCLGFCFLLTTFCLLPRSCSTVFFFLSFLYTSYSRAKAYPVDYLGEIQLTNYAFFLYDMICHNFPLFPLFLFFVVRRICRLGWVGLETGPPKWRGKATVIDFSKNRMLMYLGMFD